MVNVIDPQMTEESFTEGLMEKDAVWISAKLFGVYLIHNLKVNTGVKANRLITKIINYASSKTEDSTSFVKVFQK
jgi:hypothetical protein